MIRDAHIHSPYCPHGTNDSFESYIQKAIQLGLQDITFTEHAPMPKGFLDPTPNQDSGMREEDVMPYILELQSLQKKYKDVIRIRIGFEIDYIEGFEKETTAWLNRYGPYMDDGILSVHFLYDEDQYVCIDYSKEEFMNFSSKVGSIQKVYDLYYKTVRASIIADLGPYKPKRIGHLTLIHKFQLAHDQKIDDDEAITTILHMVAKHNLELDMNSAGYAKNFCKEPYPPLRFLKLANSLNIPFIFGSDAHQAVDLQQFSTKLRPYFK